MRVTQAMLNRNAVHRLNQTMAELSRLNEQLSTGKRVNTVSDDVFAAGRVMQLERDAQQTSAYVRNLETADTMLSCATSSLESATELIANIRTLAVQASTDTYTDADRRVMAEDVNGYLDGLVTLANVKFSGSYVFSGEATGTAAFAHTVDENGHIQSVHYDGAPISTRVETSPGALTEINLVGSTVFQRNGDVFDVVLRLRDAMEAGDREEISALLEDLETSHTELREILGRLGGRQDQLRTVAGTFDTQLYQNEEYVSELRDADVADLAVEFNTAMSRLQTIMKIAVESSLPSIVDFF